MGLAVIVGAGPAGLTAAYELTNCGFRSLVLEQDGVVGGLARTIDYRGYRFDVGGHRFFTKIDLVQQIWNELLGNELLLRERLSRICYQGKFFDYPLKPLNALRGLGFVESIATLFSYAKARALPYKTEETFEQWVVNRFGRRLYEIFFKTYTEKVWGMRCSEIRADWAAQRIKNLTLGAAVRNALFGSNGRNRELITTLVDRFHYPRLGPGMLWERCRQVLSQRGVEILTQARVTRLRKVGDRVVSINTLDEAGHPETIEADCFISSMPVRDLVLLLDPPPPADVLRAASLLRHRDHMTVGLIVSRPHLFADNWLYIHSPNVRVGRIQNFKNWSPDMVPDQSRSSLGFEYFVHEHDELWGARDDRLIEMAARECELLDIAPRHEVVDGTVIRMRNAYPVYDGAYRDALATVRTYLASLRNLQTIGRNGQHRYNNQDHSMLTGIYAARNIVGEQHDVWNVNVEPEYHEQISQRPARARGVRSLAADRLAPLTYGERPAQD